MKTRMPAAERRAQLLDVALRVFGEKGFHDTSMNDIAEAAGVTKPVLYQHFGSKRALFRELLRELVEAHYLGKGKSKEFIENAAAELYLLSEGALAASPVQCCTWPIETARRIAEERFGLLT